MKSLLLALLLLPAASHAEKASYKYYLKALLLTNQGSYTEALLEYEAALQIDPQSAFMYEQAAELALETGRVDRALEFSKRLAELSPNNARAYYLLGNVHWARGEWRQSKEAFEKTLKIKPDYQEALFALGNLLGSQSPDEARKYLNKYLKENPHNASQAEYQIAAIEQRAGRLDEAVRRLRSAIGYDSENIQAYYSLAQIYEVRRDTDAALGAYREILRRDSRNVALLNHVGEIFYLKDDLPGARDHFERARSVVPENPAACLWLALLAEQENDFKSAVDYVKASAALPQDASLNLRLSYYLTQDDRLKEAVSVLGRAHKKWPKNEELSYFLALGYDDLKMPKKAIALMHEVVVVRPDHRDARFQLGAIYEKTGDIAGAETQFREILKSHPHDASALNYLGYSLADRGLKLDEAQEMIEAAVGLNPNNGAYVDSLGWVHFRRGSPKKALAVLKDAARLLPSDEAVWAHLAEVYDHLGDSVASWNAWKTAQVLAPGNPKYLKPLAKVESSFTSEELGDRYQEFLGRRRGDLASFGGPCIIEGKARGRSFRFQGLVHFKAPWDLGVDVLGPLFVPLFRIAVQGREGFQMDPLEIEGVSQEFMRDNLFGMLSLLRDYFEGGMFREKPSLYRRRWRSHQIVTPRGILLLNKDQTRLIGIQVPGRRGLKLSLSDYQLVGDKWLPATLTLKAKGFSLEFRLSSLSANFQ
ncbi:MAG: tetratricopeptide repeat protein [Elusimicrobiota bacterium]